MLYYPVLKIDDLSGGLVTKGSELSLKINQSPDCLNVHSDIFKSLQKRLGYIALGTSQSATSNGIYNYRRTETEQYLISLWGTALKKMDVVSSAWDGGWDTINVSANGTALSSDIMHNTTFGGDCIITTEARDVPQKYDPNDNSAQYTNLHYGGSGTAPSGKFCITWSTSNRVWIANTAANQDRIACSDDADHTKWTSANWWDIITPGDVGITGWITLRGKMYVFKRWSIHRVTFLGGTPLLDIKETKSSIGTSSPRSIKIIEMPGEGEVIIFLGSDLQIYKFDGYEALPIGEAISTYNGISNYCLVGDDTTYGVNSSQFVKCHSVNYDRRHWYILFFCLGADTTPDDAIIFDYFANSFWPFHFADAFKASCISDNGAGQHKVYLAGTNYSWLFDFGNADVTTAINGYWTTGKIDFESEIQIKELRNIVFTTSSAAVTPYFQYKTNWDSSFSTAVALVTATREHTFDIPKFEELFQWKFSDNSTSAAFQLIRASIVGRAVGVAK